ncbi:hypothetical protein C8F04DRAFT_1130407 [Mycena alexandri]|uniref:Uncharacterized protein n=1 Tax=Mycena alexandri TaxID=1745969 RepID=A0AAD6WTK9_9AGAR|nr:hypothetical protein C8F04DRAFT_1130407 [Mycena alexandri]
MPRRTVQTPVRLVLMNRRPTSPCLEEAAEGKKLLRSGFGRSFRASSSTSHPSAGPAFTSNGCTLCTPRCGLSGLGIYLAITPEVSLRDMHEYPHSGRTVVDSHETPHTPGYRQLSIASRTPRLAHQLSIIQTHQRRCSSVCIPYGTSSLLEYPITHLQSCTRQGQIPKLCMTLLRGRCGRVSR